MSITLRIGTKVGAWKLTGLSLSSSIASVQSEIEAKHEIPVALQVLTLAGRRGGAEGGALAPSATLASLGLEHGSKLFCDWDGDKCIAARKSTRKTIDAQGNIVDVDYEAVAADKGFRPGMLALRSMKMQWTLAEFQSLDSKFVYDFKDIKQGKGFNAATAVCPGVSLDRSCLESFQRFVAQFQYKRARCGFLYGRRAEDGSITVEAIYEPPQTFTLPTRLRALADHEPRSRDEIRLVAGQVYFGDELDRASGVWFGRELVGVVEGSFPAAKVEEIPSEPCDGELDIDEDDKAALVTHLYERCLGLERVGWIVSHPPRKESLSGHTEYVSQFTASEIVEGASLQLEASMARLARAESERAAADSFGSGVVSMEEEGGGGAEDEEPDAKLVGGSFVSIKLTANAVRCSCPSPPTHTLYAHILTTLRCSSFPSLPLSLPLALALSLSLCAHDRTATRSSMRFRSRSAACGCTVKGSSAKAQRRSRSGSVRRSPRW